MSSFDVTKKFFRPVLSISRHVIATAFLSVFSAIVSVFSMYLLKWVTNAIQTKDIALINRIALIYGVTIAIYYLCLWIFRNADRYMYIYGKHVIGAEYYKKLIRIDNNTYDKIGSGRLVHIFSSGVNTWMDLLSGIMYGTIKFGVSILVALVTISFIGVQYLLLILIFCAIIVITYLVFKDPIQETRVKQKKTWVDEARQNAKVIMSKFEILQQNRIEQEIHKMKSIFDERIGIVEKRELVIFPLQRGPKALIDIVRVLVIIYVGASVIRGQGSIGDFAALMGLISIIDMNIIELLQQFIRLNDLFTDVEKLWETFDHSKQIRGYDEGGKFIHSSGDIVLDGITFGYGEGSDVFTDFHLHASGGKKTAIVGPSGCGKSTIIKLIAGYVHPNRGHVVVDNQKLPSDCDTGLQDTVSLESYYPHIGYLTQEPSVFDGTIFENLIYGLSNKEVLADLMRLRVSSPEGLRKHPILSRVIEQSKCEFIYDFTDGLGTEIGEKGVKLSGGQKQRLAIAKIFLKNPNIILLDEPTSALDSFSEEEVGKAFDNLFAGRTVIVVAHRLQTVKQADEIIVLKDGWIAERGRHDELVEKGGIYAKMLELQSGF